MDGAAVDLVPRGVIHHAVLELGAVGISEVQAQGEFGVLHSPEARWLAVDFEAAEPAVRARE